LARKAGIGVLTGIDPSEIINQLITSVFETKIEESLYNVNLTKSYPSHEKNNFTSF
jgi:hypothetical protein